MMSDHMRLHVEYRLVEGLARSRQLNRHAHLYLRDKDTSVILTRVLFELRKLKTHRIVDTESQFEPQYGLGA
jgi:hypothetical protein